MKKYRTPKYTVLRKAYKKSRHRKSAERSARFLYNILVDCQITVTDAPDLLNEQPGGVTKS